MERSPRNEMSTKITTLSAAFDDYPHTLPLKRGEITSARVALTFSDVKPANRFFKPMVRELKFDVSEMAIATYVQAKGLRQAARSHSRDHDGAVSARHHPVQRGAPDRPRRSRGQARRRAVLQPDHGGVGARYSPERLRGRRRSPQLGDFRGRPRRRIPRAGGGRARRRRQEPARDA